MLCRTLLSATVTTFALAAPIKACKLALVLAVDVSGSVSPDEYNIQMRGLAEALRDGAVSEALVVAKAAVSLIQWTGKSRQKVTIPWVRITNFEDTDGLADLIATQPRSWQYFSTAIGEALVLAEASFFDVPDCARKVVDVSGDGVSNEGILPRDVWPLLEASGITVNGLAIEASEDGLADYFRAEVITGAGAFAVAADDFQDYPRRIRQKLLREITKQVASLR
jgi:Ca-activated chloride channel family protein